MNYSMLVACAVLCGQTQDGGGASTAGVAGGAVSAPVTAATPVPAAPASTLPGAASGPVAVPSFEDVTDTAPTLPSTFNGAAGNGVLSPFAPPVVPATGAPVFMNQEVRGIFESDHAFDGFTTPLSNPIQSKDPRSQTELRFLYLGNYSRPSTPVIGGGTAQVYAMQVRLALNERFQLFADKDGLVMVSPKGSRSIFGMANLMAGAKYVFIRDEENQFLFSGAVQYEAPTGYSNIFEGHGNGLLGFYGIIGKQFFDNWHFVSTFGQNAALNRSNSGYFMTTAHLDRRFGKFVPFYEANWFYYNQSGNHLAGVGSEGGGLLNLGASKVMGLNYVTNAVGFNYEFNPHLIFGLAYEYQLSNRTMITNNMINAQLIFRY